MGRDMCLIETPPVAGIGFLRCGAGWVLVMDAWGGEDAGETCLWGQVCWVGLRRGGPDEGMGVRVESGRGFWVTRLGVDMGSLHPIFVRYMLAFWFYGIKRKGFLRRGAGEFF